MCAAPRSLPNPGSLLPSLPQVDGEGDNDSDSEGEGDGGTKAQQAAQQQAQNGDGQKAGGDEVVKVRRPWRASALPCFLV